MNHERICHPETSECTPVTDSSLLESALQNRRQFLSRFGQGMGAIGLAALLGVETAPPAQAALSPLAPRKPHFKPKAKRVLHIFAQGAPSHIDTFDPKPELTKADGKVMKEFDGLAFASPFKFSKHGKSGLEISEVFPKLAEHADDLCVLRSMWTDARSRASSCARRPSSIP